MNVVVKKSALEQIINKLAEERSFHSRRIDQIASDEKPVLPDAQVGIQLSADQVPVADPDFLPVNKQQLKRAASQIADAVPPEKVQKYYSGLKKLLRKTSENDTPVVTESDLVAFLRSALLEARGEGRGLEKSDQELASQLAASSAASALQTNIDLATQSAEQSGPEAVRDLKSTLVGTINRLVDEYEKKKNDGEHFPDESGYAELVADLAKPESYTINKSSNELTIRAGGASFKDRFNLASLNPNITPKVIARAAKEVADETIGDIVGSRSTSRFLGDPNAPFNRPRQRYGELGMIAKDVARGAFAQLGDALPDKSALSEDQIDDFIRVFTDFVTTQLGDGNKQFTYNVQEDPNSVNVEPTSVTITLDVPDSSSLPAAVRQFTKTSRSLSGVKASDPVQTMDKLKAMIVSEIEAVRADILAKADETLAKRKVKSFKPSGEGRNFASDILRRLGGTRRDAPAERVRAAAQELGKELGTDPMNTLTRLDVLDPRALDLRENLLGQFTPTLSDIVDEASKMFEDSQLVFEATMADIDDSIQTKGGDVWDIVYDLFKDALKEFGEKPEKGSPPVDFFKSYQRIISNPKFREYVEKRGGTYRSDMFERSGKYFFDSDTTFVGNLMLIRKYLLATGRGKDAAELIYDEDNKEYPVVTAFGDFVASNLVAGEKDYDDMVKKIVKLIETKHPEFVRAAKPKKDKKEK